MTDVRIICTHDATKLAETLTRLLEAEQHQVQLTVGRQALAQLEAAASARDAVMLIWSPDARSQTYMLEWAKRIDPSRLVEVALTQGYPRIVRKAPVIDFSHWRGERGKAAWNALNERLRAVSRALNPPKPPPKYAAFALGVASAAAVTGAIVLRANETPAPASLTTSTPERLAANDPSAGLGGPLSTVEPGAMDDDLRFRRPPNLRPLQAHAFPQLAEVDPRAEIDLRNETLLERLNALNPLRALPGGENGDES
jgi:hypothetical protein